MHPQKGLQNKAINDGKGLKFPPKAGGEAEETHKFPTVIFKTSLAIHLYQHLHVTLEF